MKFKGLVIGAITVCFAYFGTRLYDTYVNHVPVASEGECVHLKSGDVEATVVILMNDHAAGASLVMSTSNGYVIDFGYAQMRAMNAEVVECQ